MDQHAAALDVSQKVVPQADALRRAFDEAGDVSGDKGALLGHAHDAQHGRQGGEMIIADLGPRLADDRKQRRFADVGEADQPDIGDQLQLQHHIEALARQPLLGKAGHLTGGRGKMGVAEASLAAACHNDRLSAGDIGNDGVRFKIADDCPLGDAHNKVGRALAGAARTGAVGAVFGDIFSFILEIQQR